METAQRVVRRNGLLSRLLTATVAAAALLLVYAVVHANLSQAAQDRWPDLLDVQSATAALLATAGAALARAQFARTVRPALGHLGHVAADLAPGGRLVWDSHLVNAAQDVSVVVSADYRVVPADPAVPPTAWCTPEEARLAIESTGLVRDRDYHLRALGAGAALGADSRSLLAWFTEEALARIAEVYVRVRVTDRVGDVHERTVACLKGAERELRHPGPPFT